MTLNDDDATYNLMKSELIFCVLNHDQCSAMIQLLTALVVTGCVGQHAQGDSKIASQIV